MIKDIWNDLTVYQTNALPDDVCAIVSCPNQESLTVRCETYDIITHEKGVEILEVPNDGTIVESKGLVALP